MLDNTGTKRTQGNLRHPTFSSSDIPDHPTPTILSPFSLPPCIPASHSLSRMSLKPKGKSRLGLTLDCEVSSLWSWANLSMDGYKMGVSHPNRVVPDVK